jgi:hypothetical protein
MAFRFFLPAQVLPYNGNEFKPVKVVTVISSLGSNSQLSVSSWILRLLREDWSSIKSN